MHEFGAKLRIISELKKELREKYDSWALQVKIPQIIINQTVSFGQSRKEAEFETLKSVLFPIKALSLQQIPYRQKERERINSFYPVLYIKTINMTKVLNIVSDYCQTGSLSSTTYKKIEILNGFTTVLKAQLLLGINIDTIGKW